MNLKVSSETSPRILLEKDINLMRFRNNLNFFSSHIYMIKINTYTDSPGGPVGKTPCSQCRGPGFDFWWRN